MRLRVMSRVILHPDSQDARAWDYLDAIREAQRALGHRLNTWDKGDYDE
jgi:hypothetical protein